MKILYYPPPLSSQIETGAGGVQTQITEKNSDRGIYCWFFCNYIIFFYGSKGSKHLSDRGGGGGGGGGGCATFYYFFFFWGGGLGGGVQILISIETYITCDFSGGGGGGGGGSGPPIPLWIRAWVRNK